jgi:hypothetical protein
MMTAGDAVWRLYSGERQDMGKEAVTPCTIKTEREAVSDVVTGTISFYWKTRGTEV